MLYRVSSIISDNYYSGKKCQRRWREGKKKKREEMGYRWYKTFCRMIEQIPRAENGSGSVNGGSGRWWSCFFSRWQPVVGFVRSEITMKLMNGLPSTLQLM